MVGAIRQLHHDANVIHCFAGTGGPWEFNLRDLLRWCELAEITVPPLDPGQAALQPASAAVAAAVDQAVQHFAGILFLQRLRTAADRQHAEGILASLWGLEQWAVGDASHSSSLYVAPAVVQLGWARLERRQVSCIGSGDGTGTSTSGQLAVLPSSLPVLESMAGEQYGLASLCSCFLLGLVAAAALVLLPWLLPLTQHCTAFAHLPCRVRVTRLDVPAGGPLGLRQDGGSALAGGPVRAASGGAVPHQRHGYLGSAGRV